LSARGGLHKRHAIFQAFSMGEIARLSWKPDSSISRAQRASSTSTATTVNIVRSE
jgi:hypothetical protein